MEAFGFAELEAQMADSPPIPLRDRAAIAWDRKREDLDRQRELVERDLAASAAEVVERLLDVQMSEASDVSIKVTDLSCGRGTVDLKVQGIAFKAYVSPEGASLQVGVSSESGKTQFNKVECLEDIGKFLAARK